MIAVVAVKVVSFFFSSRRRHTRYWRDWSSDVCSSDLAPASGTFSPIGPGFSPRVYPADWSGAALIERVRTDLAGAADCFAVGQVAAGLRLAADRLPEATRREAADLTLGTLIELAVPPKPRDGLGWFPDAVQQLAPLLTDQQLADLFKHPVTVGPTRGLLLWEAERRFNPTFAGRGLTFASAAGGGGVDLWVRQERRFSTPWDLARWLRANRPEVDLSSPPRWPAGAAPAR